MEKTKLGNTKSRSVKTDFMKTQSVRYDFKKIKPKNTEPEAKLEKTKSGECREDRVREI